MKSVLIGIDRSQAAQRALRFAVENFDAEETRIVLAHVVNQPNYRFPTLQSNEQRPIKTAANKERIQNELLDPFLQWAREEEILGDVDVETKILYGRPSEVLSDVAIWDKIDVIVVTRTGESNLRNAIFGSTAERLAQHSSVPVVVVP